MVRRDGDFFGTYDSRHSRIFPINVEFPPIDPVVFEYSFQLRSTASHHDVWRAGRGQLLSIKIGIVQEVDAINDHALFSGWFALQHLFALHDACVFLTHVIAGACRYVIPVRPNRGTRIVRKEGPQKFIPIVGPERISSGAHRVTHRVRSLWPSLTAWTCCRGLLLRSGRRGRTRRRYE